MPQLPLAYLLHTSPAQLRPITSFKAPRVLWVVVQLLSMSIAMYSFTPGSIEAPLSSAVVQAGWPFANPLPYAEFEPTILWLWVRRATLSAIAESSYYVTVSLILHIIWITGKLIYKLECTHISKRNLQFSMLIFNVYAKNKKFVFTYYTAEVQNNSFFASFIRVNGCLSRRI